MRYKNYSCTLKISEEDELIFGHIDLDGPDIISFHGKDYTEIVTAFKDTVDDYLSMCKSLNRAPNPPMPTTED